MQLEKLWAQRKRKPKIFIIDNHSTLPQTQRWLNVSKHTIIRVSRNEGHMVWKNPLIYDCLPDRFIITDPDLEFQDSMPSSLVDTLFHVSDQYESQRVGPALLITPDNKGMFPYKWPHLDKNTYDAEKQYWAEPIQNNEGLEMYYANIDTTFCLYNKKNERSPIRIGGAYTVRHLPWYIDTPGISRYEKYIMYKDTTMSSSIKLFEEWYMRDNNIVAIPKHDEIILVQLDGSSNDDFWKHHFPTWEDETFQVFDRFLSPDKPFLDIGAWIGTTCIYGMRKSSRVVCVEVDPVSIKKLRHHITLNGCGTPVEVIEKAIYKESGVEVVFGPNAYSPSSQWNDSTSQIQKGTARKDDICVSTICLDDIIREYQLEDTSLIKVDIEGGEEFIMDDLARYIGKIPIYLSFHHSWWTDRDLTRFPFLTEAHRQQVQSNPFTSILFQC